MAETTDTDPATVAALAALDLVSERDPDVRHAATKARKAIAVRSPIRVKRLLAVVGDATHHGAGAFSAGERQEIDQALRAYVRANPDSQ